MANVSSVPQLRESQQAEVKALAERVRKETGVPPLSDQALTQLASDRARHLLAQRGKTLVGYAQLDGDELEVVAESDALSDLLAAAEKSARVVVWTHGEQSELADAVARRGYEPERVLYRLRRPSDAPLPERHLAPGIEVLPFRVGVDEAAFLAVNAAAFAEHAEQGRWSLADVAAREQEPWFDPGGFFLAWRGDQLAGFHWTKVHPDGDGEVYVLGVAPDAQGLGLGAGLLEIGLRHLIERGCPSILLYVDRSNEPAMRLYERYGFRRDDVDRQWRAPDL